MGRAPCCDKANVKKGPWSPEEDATLKSYIEENGTGGNWIALPQKIGLKRCGKSCRLRWLNYLRPNLKHGGFSEEEDRIICSLYVSIGSRWSIIAAQLPGRTDNDIKNYWNTRLKKKLLGKQRKDHGHSSMGRKSKRSSVLLDGNYSNHPPVGLPNSTFSSIPTNNQLMFPYWPTPEPYLHPIPTTNIASATTTTTTTTTTTSGFIDQSSVRSLLMKLGGRVHTNGCDLTAYYDHHNHQEGLMDLHPPFPSTDNPQISNQYGDIESQLMRSEYNLEGCLSQSILQSSVGNTTTATATATATTTTAAFPAELEELMASHSDHSQRIIGLDFMAWEEGMMINNNATRSETSTCGERQGPWGEMSPFVSLPMGSSAGDHGMIPIPAGAFDEMECIGGQ